MKSTKINNLFKEPIKMKISNNDLVLEELSFTQKKTYTFKYGEKNGFGTSEEKQPLRVNIIFQDNEFKKLEFLDMEDPVNLDNIPFSKMVIMDAITKKIKELESLIQA